MKIMLVSLLVLFIVFTSGCVGQSGVTAQAGGLEFRFSAEPDRIRQDESTTFHIDIENLDTLDYFTVGVQAFDSGLLQFTNPPGVCTAFAAEVRQRQIESRECTAVVANPDALIKPEEATTVRFRAGFSKKIRETFPISMLSLSEWRRQQTLGRTESGAQAFTGGDKNVKMGVSFSKAQPFVEGDKIIYQITFSNAAEGDLKNIDKFQVQYQGIVLCELERALASDKGVFPPITCVLRPSDILGESPSATAPMTFVTQYTYEIRSEIPVTIVKK